ncbi:MAG: nitroreductase [Acidimicrobiia bacterium]|nr:nitroreductase [Acidimicrobiia bacterium]
MTELPSADSVGDLIRQRRTNLRMDPDGAIDEALIASLCEAAVWAPNHKLTEPWRFAVIRGSARRRLGEAAARGLMDRGVTDPARLEKTRHKYERAPVILVVGCAANEDPARRLEDRDAVAAGIQNLLLTATAAGLASYWGTGIAADLAEVNELCGFEPDTAIVGIIYIGVPTGEAPVPGRSAPVVNWVDS